MTYLKTLLQIAFICGVSLLGQWLSATFNLPLPGNLIGMFILLALLFSGVIKESHIQSGADLLLKYMSLFFIPAGVGLLAHLDLIRAQFVPWLLVILLTTVIVLILTGKLVDRLIHKEAKL
jgi:holin-like protein